MGFTRTGVTASQSAPGPRALTPVPSPAPTQPPSPGEGDPVGAVLPVSPVLGVLAVLGVLSCLSPSSPGEGGWEGAGEEGRGDEGLGWDRAPRRWISRKAPSTSGRTVRVPRKGSPAGSGDHHASSAIAASAAVRTPAVASPCRRPALTSGAPTGRERP